MSQRSSKNARTQKRMTGDRQGMTRKGASRAKPSRAAATTVHSVAPGKASSSAQKSSGGQAAKTNKSGLFSGLSGNAQKREARQRERERRDREMLATNILLKRDPRYSTYRKIWWGLLGAGLVMTIVSWAAMFAFPEVAAQTESGLGTVSTVALIIAYACIIGGFIFDWIKVRPLRRKCETTVRAMSDKKMVQLLEEDYVAREKAKENRRHN